MATNTDDRTLYIGNLHKNVSDDVLYELFLQAGPVERVNIVNISDTFRYGFVTYKHEVSIDYALQLYKGICLFNKEISIKKKGKSTNNSQQSNDFSKHNAVEQNDNYRRNTDLRQFAQEQLHNGLQNYRVNNNSDLQVNFKVNSLEGNWSGRSKPYDRGAGLRKHISRSHEQRHREQRHQGRNDRTNYSRNKRY